MSAAKHTPGPWRAETQMPSDNATVWAVCDENGPLEWPAPVADCADFEERRPVAEAQANARLIAAAPDLLEALRRIVTPAPGVSHKAPAWVYGIAKAAIAKAEGRTDA